MENYGVEVTGEEMAKVDELVASIKSKIKAEGGMTPRQRFDAVARGEKTDRLPIQCSPMGLHAAKEYGVTPASIYQDPKVSLLAYLTHLERYGYDTISPFRFSAGEKEFGQTVVETDSGVSFGSASPVKTCADLDKISIPDPRKDGTLPWSLWMIGLLKEKLGDIMPIYGFSVIPGAVNPVVLPMGDLYVALREDRELCHCITALLMRFIIEYVTAMFAAGADQVMIVGTADQVSYKTHREFEFPYVCGLTKSIPGPVFTVGSEDWSHVLESYVDAGVAGWLCHGHQPLDTAKEISVRRKVVLRYGVPGDVLVHGPVERIREEVKRIAEIGKEGGYFVLGTDVLDYSTPPEHVDAYMAAAREFARLS